MHPAREEARPDATTWNVARLLRQLGADTRPGEAESVAAALSHLTSGYGCTPADAIGDALFEEEASQPVLVRDIPFTSLCRRHLVPFHGRVHVAYLPDGRVVGLSKLARVVDVLARRLQTQTSLTDEIAEALQEVLRPRGVGVWMEARHDCPGCTGTMLTRSVLGDLRLPLWSEWIGALVR